LRIQGTRFRGYRVHGFEDTEYMVSRIQGTWFRGYRVHGFEDTGYMVSRIQGTWFRGYRVHGFEDTGYTVSRIQGTWFRGYRVHGFELEVQAQNKMKWPLRLRSTSNSDARCKMFSEVRRKYLTDNR